MGVEVGGGIDQEHCIEVKSRSIKAQWFEINNQKKWKENIENSPNQTVVLSESGERGGYVLESCLLEQPCSLSTLNSAARVLFAFFVCLNSYEWLPSHCLKGCGKSTLYVMRCQGSFLFLTTLFVISFFQLSLLSPVTIFRVKPGVIKLTVSEMYVVPFFAPDTHSCRCLLVSHAPFSLIHLHISGLGFVFKLSKINPSHLVWPMIYQRVARENYLITTYVMLCLSLVYVMSNRFPSFKSCLHTHADTSKLLYHGFLVLYSRRLEFAAYPRRVDAQTCYALGTDICWHGHSDCFCFRTIQNDRDLPL